MNHLPPCDATLEAPPVTLLKAPDPYETLVVPDGGQVILALGYDPVIRATRQ
jgi:hypothetical protein